MASCNRPKRMSAYSSTVRSQRSMTRGSWVAMMTTRSLRACLFISPMTSCAEASSRFPVGSSARITDGSDKSARHSAILLRLASRHLRRFCAATQRHPELVH